MGSNGTKRTRRRVQLTVVRVLPMLGDDPCCKRFNTTEGSRARRGAREARVENFVMAKRPRRVPVVLTREEVALLLTHLAGVPRLMASLLYGSGLRLLECVTL